MNDNTIYIDIEDGRYVLDGDVGVMLENRRLLFPLRRLKFMEEGGKVYIPFQEPTKISVLQEIQDSLAKFNLQLIPRQQVKDNLSTYHNEQQSFAQLADRARKIRNNEIVGDQQLVDGFDHFQTILNRDMRRTLYQLQLLSAYHMAFAQHACNFAVPGAGKTSIVYGAYTYLKSLPKDDSHYVDKLLVIGPLSSFAVWEDEYKECFGREVTSKKLSDDSLSKDQKEHHLYTSETPKELTLISHHGIKNLEQGILYFLRKNQVMVVVDEAHRIKNAEGVWGNSAVEIAKEARARVILTGTPVPNGYEDLYNLFRFIYPFKYSDILQIHYDQLKELTRKAVATDEERVERFIDNIQPYFIRIKKQDLGLPEPKEKTISVIMDQQQRQIYDFIEESYVKSFRTRPQATVKDILNKAKLIRLRQAATNPALLLKTLQESLDDEDPNLGFTTTYSTSIDDSTILKNIESYSQQVPQKFIKVKEILDNDTLTKDAKVIVWTIFIQNAEELQNYLENEGIKTRLLIGRIPQDERVETIKQFNDPQNNSFRVVVANPFSVAESISLHKGCHNAIYLERDYNVANFLQSKDRIHRVGLPKEVVTQYYYLISDDSIDSVIDNKLAIKVKRMNKIIDNDIPLLGRINDEDETDIITALLKAYDARKAQ